MTEIGKVGDNTEIPIVDLEYNPLKTHLIGRADPDKLNIYYVTNVPDYPDPVLGYGMAPIEAGMDQSANVNVRLRSSIPGSVISTWTNGVKQHAYRMIGSTLRLPLFYICRFDRSVALQWPRGTPYPSGILRDGITSQVHLNVCGMLTGPQKGIRQQARPGCCTLNLSKETQEPARANEPPNGNKKGKSSHKRLKAIRKRTSWIPTTSPTSNKKNLEERIRWIDCPANWETLCQDQMQLLEYFLSGPEESKQYTKTEYKEAEELLHLLTTRITGIMRMMRWSRKLQMRGTCPELCLSWILEEAGLPKDFDATGLSIGRNLPTLTEEECPFPTMVVSMDDGTLACPALAIWEWDNEKDDPLDTVPRTVHLYNLAGECRTVRSPRSIRCLQNEATYLFSRPCAPSMIKIFNTDGEADEIDEITALSQLGEGNQEVHVHVYSATSPDYEPNAEVQHTTEWVEKQFKRVISQDPIDPAEGNQLEGYPIITIGSYGLDAVEQETKADCTTDASLSKWTILWSVACAIGKARNIACTTGRAMAYNCIQEAKSWYEQNPVGSSEIRSFRKGLRLFLQDQDSGKNSDEMTVSESTTDETVGTSQSAPIPWSMGQSISARDEAIRGIRSFWNICSRKWVTRVSELMMEDIIAEYVTEYEHDTLTNRDLAFEVLLAHRITAIWLARQQRREKTVRGRNIWHLLTEVCSSNGNVYIQLAVLNVLFRHYAQQSLAAGGCEDIDSVVSYLRNARVRETSECLQVQGEWNEFARSHTALEQKINPMTCGNWRKIYQVTQQSPQHVWNVFLGMRKFKIAIESCYDLRAPAVQSYRNEAWLEKEKSRVKESAAQMSEAGWRLSAGTYWKGVYTLATTSDEIRGWKSDADGIWSVE